MHTEVCESLYDIFRITLPNLVGSFNHEPMRVCPGCRELAIRKQNNDASKRRIHANTKLGKQMLHFSVYFTTQLLCTAKTDSQVTMTMLQIKTFVLARSEWETFAKKKRKRRSCFESVQRFWRWKSNLNAWCSSEWKKQTRRERSQKKNKSFRKMSRNNSKWTWMLSERDSYRNQVLLDNPSQKLTFILGIAWVYKYVYQDC